MLANLVKRFDSDVADGGDVLHVPKVSNLTANAKAANTQVTLNSPTETEFTMNINRHFEASYLVEDRLKFQAKYNILEQYSPKDLMPHTGVLDVAQTLRGTRVVRLSWPCTPSKPTFWQSRPMSARNWCRAH